MKIVVADGLPSSALECLGQPDWSIDAKQGRHQSELAAALADADALIVRSATKVTHELIDAAPRLKVIARAGTGVDNVDVAAATARGIVVMNAPGANSVSVAEHDDPPRAKSDAQNALRLDHLEGLLRKLSNIAAAAKQVHTA